MSRATPKSFDRFWAAYPRKVGKLAALKAWKRIKVSAKTAKAMLAALEWQTQELQWRCDGGQFIPHPATWLSQGRWLDEPPGGRVTATYVPPVKPLRYIYDVCQHVPQCRGFTEHERRQ